MFLWRTTQGHGVELIHQNNRGYDRTGQTTALQPCPPAGLGKFFGWMRIYTQVAPAALERQIKKDMGGVEVRLPGCPPPAVRRPPQSDLFCFAIHRLPTTAAADVFWKKGCGAIQP